VSDFFKTISEWVFLVYLLNVFYLLLKYTEEHSDELELEIYPGAFLVVLMLFNAIYFTLSKNAELNYHGQDINPRTTREVSFLLHVSLVLTTLLPGYALALNFSISTRLYQVLPKCRTGRLISTYAVLVVAYFVPKLVRVLAEKTCMLLPQLHAAGAAPCFLAQMGAAATVILSICAAHAFFALLERLLLCIDAALAVYAARGAERAN
jgi:hypothetical protein